MNGRDGHVDEAANEEQEHLLPHHVEMTDMADLNSDRKLVDGQPNMGKRYHDQNEELSRGGPSGQSEQDGILAPTIERPVEYKVYKRRWFGLMQLVLLNIVVSWDWLSFSAVANTAATYFSTTPSIINWLSTSFLFAFVLAAPFTLYALHLGGPRLAFIYSSLLILVGNWIRYAGTRISPPSFPLTMFGQILIGLAQPFVLAAPTRYSDLWFSPRGRVSATAIASLANPFGGALGQLINPFLCPTDRPHTLPNMVLYVAIISSVATIPTFFLPAKPPKPVSPSSAHAQLPLRKTLRLLFRSLSFYLVLLPFSAYVGFFNSVSSLLTQILTPYAFSETESGIAGALLILVGLVAAAAVCPLVDRSKAYLPVIKSLVAVVAASYLAFIWAPPTRTVVAPYLILSILGAGSFSLLPVALEWLAEVTYPVGPEASSVVLWTGGQLLGGIFIVISDALKTGNEGEPPFHMQHALIFEAVVAVAVAPSAFALGWVGGRVEEKRLGVDKGETGGRGSGER